MIVDSNCSLASFCLLLFARFCRGNRAQVVRVRQGPSKRAQTQPGAPDPRSKESEALSEKVARRARVEGQLEQVVAQVSQLAVPSLSGGPG